MSILKSAWQYMFSPKLYKVHGDGSIEKLYEPTGLERWGDQIIHSLSLMWTFSLYTSPIIASFLYKKGYFAAEGLMTFTKLATGIGIFLIVSYCMRGIGRASNPNYKVFIKSYTNVVLKKESKNVLQLYDFEFKHWPVDFNWNDVNGDRSKLRKSLPSPVARNRTSSQWVTSLPCQIAAYAAVHTFGIRMIYPGSIGLLQSLMSTVLLNGRIKLIAEHYGNRFKLRTEDGNDIDTMFVNNKNKTEKGDTLVICSEGNAGFYEIGIMCTPIEAGYSVLGWNHPGFCGSTGRPYPSQDQNAMDTVMQFAINRLGFTPENIILFGWSIGGYSSAWAAMNYPDIKGVVLDATFDDVLALAIPRMPSSWEGIVSLAIREYCNLNIIEHLYQFPGPVLLIRRTEDEVICTVEADLSSNRGNHLLIKLMKYRYPLIFGPDQLSVVKDFLFLNSHGQNKLLQRYTINEDICLSLLSSYVSENSKSYPMLIGDAMDDRQKDEMALFLIRKHLKDYKSSHCTPLPQEYLQVPWDIPTELDYVFT